MRARIILVLLLGILGTSLVFAGGQGEKAGTAGAAGGGGLLFSSPVTLKVLIPENPSWPFRKDWYILDVIKRKTNISFDPVVVGTDYDAKVNIIMASGNLPDIVSDTSGVAMRYGAQGAFVNAFDYEKDMPNFAKWRKDNMKALLPFISADGKFFMFPAIEIGETERQGWFYRKDIFEKNGLTLPVDDAAFYKDLSTLKQKYPDSYPFTCRQSLYRLSLMAPQFGAHYDYYYDAASGAWKFGAIEDTMKQMVTYWNKLYKDGLLTPDFLSISTQSWVDQVSASKAFVTFDWLTRIDFFNTPLRQQDPSYEMYFMPPWKGGTNGQQKIENTVTFDGGLSVCNTAHKSQALKYMDWLCSDEGRNLISWGEEGVTYKVVDGKKQFINVKEPNALWRDLGIMTQGFYVRFDVQSNVSLCSPEVAYGLTVGHNYDMEPATIVNFTESEQEITSTVGQAISKLRDEQLSKFMTGERDLSQWDQYVASIKDLGLDKMLQLYATGYERLKKLM